MLSEIIANRQLIGRLALNEFRGRYAGQALGAVWAVVQPLVMIVMYTLIFAVVLKIKVGVEGSVTEFGLFLICGMLPFNAVAGAIRQASGIYVQQSHMLRRIPMPPIVLPAAQVLMTFWELGIAMLLFVGLLAVTGHGPGVLAPGVLLLVPVQAAMALGLAAAVASLTVMVRDVGALVEPLLTIWFLGTPVFYPRSMVPGVLREIIDANPMTPLVEGFRAFVLYNRLPPFGDMLYLVLVSGFLLLAGHWVYRQTRCGIIDHV